MSTNSMLSPAEPGSAAQAPAPPPVLQVDHLVKHYPGGGGFLGRKATVRALDGVSLSLPRGETLAVVGESGCGKSTLARVILQLVPPTSGNVRLHGEPVRGGRDQLAAFRRRVQPVFQDPYASLNPRQRAWDIVAEPLFNYGMTSKRERRDRAVQLLASVGLPAEKMDAFPFQFSGGQRQRLGIARALALGPDLLVCDEPVSALDVSVQAQIINLLTGIQRSSQVACLFISHDLAVVSNVSHRVVVMYLGQVVESAPTEEIFARPLHPYTQALLSAVPDPDPRRRVSRILLKGDPPSPMNPPSGCRFHERCQAAMPTCREAVPPLRDMPSGRQVACHLYPQPAAEASS